MELKKTLKKIVTLGKHPLYEEGIQLYNEGFFPEALEIFKKIVTRGQNEASLHFNLASFYSGLIHRNLGLLFLHKGDFSEAIAHFNRALEFNPTHYEIYNYLGIAYNNWKKYPKAMSAFSRVLKLAPELLSLRYKVAIVLYNLKKYDQALEEIRRLIGLNPKFADLHYHLGVIYAHQRQFKEAQKAFSHAVDLNPYYLQAKIELSLIEAAQGNHELAMEKLKAIIKLRPNYPDLYYNIGVIQAAQKDWKGARDSIMKALEINKNYSNAHFILGILSLRNNEPEAAEQAIQRALELDLEEPKRSLAKNILDYLNKRKEIKPNEDNAAILAQLNPLQEGYLEEMLQVYPQHLPIVPDYFEIMEKFGSKWDRPLLTTLVKLYEDAVAETPHYADLHFQLGKIYDQMEAWDKAILALTKALEINPLFSKARIHLYQIFLKVQMPERAKNELEFLMQQGIQFPDLSVSLAEIYLGEKDWDAAMSCLYSAMEKNPGFEKAFLLASVLLEKKEAIDQAIRILEEFKDKNRGCSNEVALRIHELEKKRDGA